MAAKRTPPKALYGRVPQDLRAKVRARRARILVLSDTVQGSAAERLRPPLAGTGPLDRCGTGLSPHEAMGNEPIQGDERDTYSALGRTGVTERGRAYGPRGLGLRRARSSRGRHAPPGRPGKPVAGRRGSGVCVGTARRYARCGAPQRPHLRPLARVVRHWKAQCDESRMLCLGWGRQKRTG